MNNSIQRLKLTFLDLVDGLVQIRSAFDTFVKSEAFLQAVVNQIQNHIEQNLVAPNVHDALVLVVDVRFDNLDRFPSLIGLKALSYEQSRRAETLTITYCGAVGDLADILLIEVHCKRQAKPNFLVL